MMISGGYAEVADAIRLQSTGREGESRESVDQDYACIADEQPQETITEADGVTQTGNSSIRKSNADNVKDHNYATIPGEHDAQSDSGAYSYAYMDRARPQATTKPQEGKGNAKSAYQELGTVDYTQMYSRASPLLVGSTAVAGSRQGDYMHTYPRPSPLLAGSIAVAGSHNDVEEKGYRKLESTTLNAESVYTV